MASSVLRKSIYVSSSSLPYTCLLSDTDELYIVKYDIQNAKVEIYNTKGYEGKYSLTDIEQIEK